MLTLPACAATNLYTPSLSASAGYDKCVYDVHDAADDDDGDDAAADDDISDRNITLIVEQLHF